jgi:hypothetical protein
MPVERLCQNPACSHVFYVLPSRVQKKRGFFCSHRCRHTMQTLAERFWSKVQRCAHGDDCPFCCWPWLAGQDQFGYGKFTLKVCGRNQRISAHRIAWELTNNRPIPIGLFGLHHCDVCPCSNPWHIYIGTAQDNANDMVRRNRRPKFRGEYNQRARLKDVDIPIIRIRYANGERPVELARAFGVSRVTISMIVHRKRWTHIP